MTPRGLVENLPLPVVYWSTASSLKSPIHGPDEEIVEKKAEDHWCAAQAYCL